MAILLIQELLELRWELRMTDLGDLIKSPAGFIERELLKSMMEYYKLKVDPEANRWDLRVNVPDADSDWPKLWAYSRGEFLPEPHPVSIRVHRDGPRLDFNDTDFEIFVVSVEAAKMLEAVAGSDVQRIPTCVSGQENKWEIINVCRKIDAINHQASSIQYFPFENDGTVELRPELAGKPRGVFHLAIHAEKLTGVHVLRLVDWSGPIIISAEVKRALEHESFTGLEFEEIETTWGGLS